MVIAALPNPVTFLFKWACQHALSLRQLTKPGLWPGTMDVLHFSIALSFDITYSVARIDIIYRGREPRRREPDID